MSLATVIVARLRGLFDHKRMESELDEEIQFHLEMQIEDNLKAGMEQIQPHFLWPPYCSSPLLWRRAGSQRDAR